MSLELFILFFEADYELTGLLVSVCVYKMYHWQHALDCWKRMSSSVDLYPMERMMIDKLDIALKNKATTLSYSPNNIDCCYTFMFSIPDCCKVFCLVFCVVGKDYRWVLCRFTHINRKEERNRQNTLKGEWNYLSYLPEAWSTFSCP